MKIQFLGTAAAEGWPALFCKCAACAAARKLGGKNIRTRSQSMIDGKLLIDFPADTYMHVLKYQIDLAGIGDILITHSHEDHFYPQDMMMKAPPYAHGGPGKAVNVYGNDVVVEMLTVEMNKSGIEEIGSYISPNTVMPFVPFTAGEYKVTALLANHMVNEKCYIYIVEKGEKSLLYAHDTGLFPRETWDFLKCIKFDAVSLDCTFGPIYNERGHLGLPNAFMVKENMIQSGCADSNTKFIVNHFSHNGNKTHEELSLEAENLGFLTAYDGMTVEF